MTREEAKDVFLNRGFIEVEGCRGRIFHADKWREACVVISEWLKSPEQEPNWIPVSEKLPEESENVLICDIDGDVYIAYMRNIIYANRIAWSDASSFDYIKNVVAWMPLPKAYKAESEGQE